MINASAVSLATPYEVNKLSLVLLDNREVGYIKFDQNAQRYRLTDGISCLVGLYETVNLALGAAEKYFLKKKYMTVDLKDTFYPFPQTGQIALIVYEGVEVGHVACHSGRNLEKFIAGDENSRHELPDIFTHSFWAVDENSPRRYCCPEASYLQLTSKIIELSKSPKFEKSNFSGLSSTGMYELKENEFVAILNPSLNRDL